MEVTDEELEKYSVEELEEIADKLEKKLHEEILSDSSSEGKSSSSSEEYPIM